jgi:hypothetical protein
MWILPNNHPLHSTFAQECVASKEDLNEHAPDLVGSVQSPRLMWKSKPSSITIWLSRWNRVYWIRHLFGRILKPSIQDHFVTRLTESLPDIHVSPSHLPGNEEEKMIPDTFIRLYQDQSKQLDLFSASSKTSEDISVWDTERFTKTFDVLVMRLSQESSQRRRLARHIRERDSSSLQSEETWLTPRSTEIEETYENYLERMKSSPDPKNNTKTKDGNLSMQVQHSELTWSTPNAQMRDGRQKPGSQLSLSKQVHGVKKNGESWMNWPTPTPTDIYSENLSSTQQKDGSMHSVTLPQAIQKEWPTPKSRDHMGMTQRGVFQPGDAIPNMINFLQGQENNNTRGKNLGQLNPAWVLQLMGTTLEKTFCEWPVMQSLNKPQK